MHKMRENKDKVIKDLAEQHKPDFKKQQHLTYIHINRYGWD